MRFFKQFLVSQEPLDDVEWHTISFGFPHTSTEMVREIIRRIVQDGEVQTPEFFMALEDLMTVEPQRSVKHLRDWYREQERKDEARYLASRKDAR